MPESAEQAYRTIDGDLRSLRRRWGAVKLLRGFFLAVLFVLSSGLLFALTETLFWLSPPVRILLAAAVAGGALLILIIYGVVPLLKESGLERFALRVEHHFPQFKQRLIGALQLWRKRGENRQRYSEKMVEETVLQAEALARNVDFHRVIDPRPLVRSLGAAAAVCCLWILLLAAFSPSLGQALGRCFSPSTKFVRPASVTIRTLPGDTSVAKGENLKITIVLVGKIPPRVSILSRPLSPTPSQWSKTILHTGSLDSDTLFCTFDNLKESMDYYVRAGRAQSPVFRASVYELPTVKEIFVRYRFPAYTRLGNRVESTGNISAVKGTKVFIKVLANKAIEEARLVFERRPPLAMKADHRVAEAQLLVGEDDQYHVELTDTEGRRNRQPIRYRIEALRDKPPAVRIVRPGENTDLADDMLLPLRIEAVDDFGFSQMELLFARADADSHIVHQEQIPISSASELTVVEEHLWDLTRVGLLPGDSLFYQIRVYDNDSLQGPKPAESRRFVVRFPTIEEIFDKSSTEQTQQVSAMEEMARQLEATRERLEELRRKALKQQDLNWDEKRELQTAIETQEQIAAELSKISEHIDQVSQQLERRDLVTPETVKKLEQLRNLLEETVTPEMKEALNELRQAVQKLAPQQLQQALKDFNFSQEELQKSIERTISILRQLQIEQQMDALVKQAEELVRRQGLLKEETLPGADTQKLAGRQEMTKNDTERLRQGLERMKELSPAWEKQIELQLRLMDEKAFSAKMDQTVSLLQEERTAEAGQMEEAISADLSQLADGLKSLQKAMLEGFRAEIAAEMEQALHDLLYLSFRQEEILSRQVSPPQQLWLTPMGQNQQELREGASIVAQSLDRVASKSFWVSDRITGTLRLAIDKMNQAITAFEGRNLVLLNLRQEEALGALNRTAILLYQSLSALSQSPSATGMSEMLQKLQQLSQQQQQLNQATQQFEGKQGLSLQQEDLLASLAAQQMALQQAIEELARRMGARRDVLGRIDQLGQEMEQVARELGRRQVTPQTLERQRRILSRLLDAQKSLRKAGFSRRRESQVGQDRTHTRGIALPPDLGERENLLRYELQKALKQGYPREYEELLLKYFQAISDELTDLPR